ncbi:MAG: site-specific integrase [Thalassolituus oleivorans]|nr:site-specific integrase [Thalassolituus oleivorans]
MQAKLSSTSVKRLDIQEKAYEIFDLDIKGFLLRVQPTGRKTFYYSYRNHAGKRTRIKVGVLGASLTLAQARDRAARCAGKVAEGIDIQAEKMADRHEAREALNHTLAAFLENHYKPWALANFKSGQQTINSVTRSFPDYLLRPMPDIQIKQIERWRTEKLRSGLKPSTINRIVSALRGVLTKALEWDVIQEHPLARLKSLKLDESKKARYLTTEEYERLLKTLALRDKELKAARDRGNAFREQRGYPLLPALSLYTYGDRMTPLVIVSLKTGMRRGEAFDLSWSDVDFDNKVITIRGENAKSSKTRHIPLSAMAYATLTAWQQQAPQPKGRVFPADDGGRLDNVRKSWKGILAQAEISQFRWHDMRHDFASKLVMKGVPLNTVRELCGHASLNTTLRYAHLAPDHKAKAVALLD